MLAPLLFAAQAGSLAALHTQTRLIKYADDFTLLIPYSRDAKSQFLACVREEINNIQVWCAEHGLLVNAGKTKCMFFGKESPSTDIRDVLPDEVSELKVLGITYEKTLKWDIHVDHITKVAGRRVHVLRYLRRIRSITKHDLLLVYRNYISSILQFNSPLFVGLNSKNSDKN